MALEFFSNTLRHAARGRLRGRHGRVQAHLEDVLSHDVEREKHGQEPLDEVRPPAGKRALDHEGRA
eukprot:CAMPEP_0195073438 /NCGR_PEP_ID=MMETSP0448-20130528/16773_1 /TAXON_ID=66468 /ORGANISM="Heterocapsa triquestra, Strain CCMP 448" /LENGTH=65 /DNA_ID=CAMNT_0040105551 /DNA_START=470 /DNA_END=667 /DNA_ORIENTATION=-